MFKPTSFLTFHIFLGSISFAAAAPLDAPGTVYIDGLPCNKACQDYMAWSRQVSGKRSEGRAPMATQPPVPARPSHAKKAASPKSKPAHEASLENPKRAAQADRPADKVEVKPAPSVAAPSVPIPPPDPRAGRETTTPQPAQLVAAPPAQEPPAAPPAQSQISEAAPPAAASTELPSDAKTATDTAALPTGNEEQTIAILLVREEIKSLADLSNRKVAIDASQASDVPDIKTAISRAGATGVEISEGTKFALGRVMDGEVPAGIIMLSSPEGAAQWTGVPGYTVLKLPLVRAKGSPG